MLSNLQPSQENNVWASINKGIDAFASYQLARVSRSKAPDQSAAAPSGNTRWTIWNPFPGTQGSYPQAEGKPSFETSNALGNLSWLMIVVVALLLVFALLRR